ncbi:MAG TPA: hypothetical protein VH701_28065 [Vicinamibacterales bacterium]|jgi:hypothetical protein
MVSKWIISYPMDRSVAWPVSGFTVEMFEEIIEGLIEDDLAGEIDAELHEGCARLTIGELLKLEGKMN